MISQEVAPTAYLTALARAAATADPAVAFDDQYAARFADNCPAAIRGIAQRTAGLSVVVARSSIIDRIIAQRIADGGIDLCVNLGAGFDSRAFRFAWPAGCTVLEIDTKSVLDVKDRLLPVADTPVRVERLRCDVRDLPALATGLAAYPARRRTLIVTEGLLPYFPESYIAGLAQLLAGLGIEPTWITDVMSSDSACALTAAARTAGVQLEMFGLRTVEAFEDAGWRCGSLDLLPSARLSGGARGRGTASSLVPDGVLTLTAGRATR
jgi:methyltransferase (TIGR00027 family)